MSRLATLWRTLTGRGSSLAYDITIASVGGTRTIQFRIRRSVALAALIGLAAMILIIFIGAVTAGHQMREAARARTIKAENAELRRQLTRMVEVEDRVRTLEETRKSLMQLIGVGEDDASAELGTAAEDPGSGGSPLARVEPDSLLTDSELTEIKASLRRSPLVGPLTRSFGRLASSGYFHSGVDVAGDTGMEILAPGDGVVTFVGTDATLGQVLVISHDTGLETLYGHASRVLVRMGDGVSAGQSIALVGNTGQSSAPHLHFEIHWKGKAIDPEDIYPDYWQ